MRPYKPTTTFRDTPIASVTDLTNQVDKLRSERREIEVQIENLAEQYNDITDPNEKVTAKQTLTDIVARWFDIGGALQASEANLLAKKLELIEEQFRLRERNRETIIQQRLKNLMDENRSPISRF